MTTDEKYMRRCLQLARGGMQNAKPNPMVGAVIVAQDRIIGEGYHVRCGEGHAEVNAFASVKPQDEPLLKEATIYVSLEPCSHYGKTPPCADLIIRKGVKRCVVGSIDPFAKVHGNGIRKLREAGIEVDVFEENSAFGKSQAASGIVDACKELNKRFFTFHTHHRPYILLKWCKTANGFLDDNFKPALISTPFTQMLAHKLRSEYDAILVGRVTDERDKPQLNVRHWVGNDPMRIVIDRNNPCFNGLDFNADVPRQIAEWLYREGKQSLIVEGGAKTLQSFIDAGLWDEIRIETGSISVNDGTKAPAMPHCVKLVNRTEYGENMIEYYEKNI